MNECTVLSDQESLANHYCAELQLRVASPVPPLVHLDSLGGHAGKDGVRLLLLS